MARTHHSLRTLKRLQLEEETEFAELVATQPRFSGVLAVAITVAPGRAQPAHQPPRAGSFAFLVGLPVFTSNGRRIGVVTGFANYHGQALLIAGIEQPLDTRELVAHTGAGWLPGQCWLPRA
jgi:hypothetical protein